MFADGMRRQRNIPLSEKLLPGESALAAARRGIAEELCGSVSDSGEGLEVTDTGRVETKREVSQSYPGLMSQVREKANSNKVPPCTSSSAHTRTPRLTRDK